MPRTELSCRLPTLVAAPKGSATFAAVSNLLNGIRTIRDLPIDNKRLFIRVDFNVPMEDGKITDDLRIREALPTIKHALEREARVILGSHMGRPKPGKDNSQYSLEACGIRLAELIDAEVHMPDDCLGDAAKKVIFDLRPGQVCLLENLRFHPEEEQDDEAFAFKLSELAEIYVNDAFGAVHRAHASVHRLAKMFRDKGCGFLLEKEASGHASPNSIDSYNVASGSRAPISMVMALSYTSS